MSSDDSRRTVEPGFRAAGVGYFSLFACVRCQKARSCLGRRKLKYRGVHQWVCSECAGAMEAKQ